MIEPSVLAAMMALARQEANRHEMEVGMGLRDSLWDLAYARALLRILAEQGWSLVEVG